MGLRVEHLDTDVVRSRIQMILHASANRFHVTPGDERVYETVAAVPRKVVVGKAEDFEALEQQVEAFARNQGVTFMRVYARKGFEYLIDRRSWTFGQGWRPGPRVFTKRLDMH